MSEADEYLPLSGLQHMVFCERQCALIHVEQVWIENALTLSGRILHERVDSPTHTTRPGVRVERALPLRSDRLRLVGKADVVELRRDRKSSTGYRVYPVEYKRGTKGKRRRADQVQLCAQAMALEEMLGVTVPEGALFYGASKRRQEVRFEAELRELVESTARRFHQMFRDRETPRVATGRWCRKCSLREICLPEVTSAGRDRAMTYLSRVFD